MVDDCSRDCLAIDAAGSVRSGCVIEVLFTLISVDGAPRDPRSHHGLAFIASALLRWLATNNLETAFFELGKPLRDGHGESSNGKLRDDCVSLEWL